MNETQTVENVIYIVLVAENEWDIYTTHSAYSNRDRAWSVAADLRKLKRSDSAVPDGWPRFALVKVHAQPYD